MKFSHRVIGAAAGTAVLGLAALAIADATAGHPSHPQATTLAAVSRTRPPAGPAGKQITARNQITGSSSAPPAREGG